MKILVIFLSGVILANVSAKLLDMNRLELDIDPKYIKASSHLQKSEADGIHVVNLDLQVLKEESDVSYMATVYRHNVDHYELVYKSELVSGCSHEELKDPILQFIFKESKRYGNITEACPLKVGHYGLRGFKIDSDDLPHQLPSGSYRFDFSAFIKMGQFWHEIYTDKYYYSN